MAGPVELINQRYGDVFLSKSRNLKIVSREAGNQVPVQFTEYNALLSTGALNPVVVTALVQGAGPAEGGLLRELNWSSVHVRSYRSWDEVVSAGINLVDTEPQKPMVMSGRQGKDLNIRAQAETETAKSTTSRAKEWARSPSSLPNPPSLPAETIFLARPLSFPCWQSTTSSTSAE